MLSVEFQGDNISNFVIDFTSSGEVNIQNMHVTFGNFSLYLGSFSFSGSFAINAGLLVTDGCIMISGQLSMDVDVPFTFEDVEGHL